MTKAIKSNAAKAKQFFADKMTFTTGPVEISHQIEKGEDVAIIDVRESKDFKKGHVPGAISLPQKKWGTLAGLRRDTMNIVYCYAQNCHLGAHAAMQFATPLRFCFHGLNMIARVKTFVSHGCANLSPSLPLLSVSNWCPVLSTIGTSQVIQ